MNSTIVKTEEFCSFRSEIAAYIDGELSAREEIELETHLAICKNCARELNEQKKLLQALDFALEKENEIELPANFTKVVVANAESKVSGLRCSRERSRALLVCAALLLLTIFGLGGEIKPIFGTFAKFAEQFLAVGGFVWNLIYDVAIGAGIILRSLGKHLFFNSNLVLIVPIIFIFFSVFKLSRIFRADRS